MSVGGRLFRPGGDKLEAQKDIDGLSGLASSGRDADQRRRAVEALSRLGGSAVVEPLVAALEDTDEAVAAAAQAGLSRLDPCPGSALIGALAGSAGEAALRILSEDDRSAEWLRTACSEGNEEVRVRALETFVDAGDRLSGDERTVLFRTLLGALGDRSPRCRVFAAETLGSFGDPAAGRALAAQLKDGDEGVRAACRAALADLGEPVVPNILDALTSRNSNSRILAAGLLAEICSDETGVETLRVVLFELADRVSASEAGEAVRTALKSIPADAVIVRQIECLGDPERGDHEEIAEFLDTILTVCKPKADLAENITSALHRYRAGTTGP